MDTGPAIPFVPKTSATWGVLNASGEATVVFEVPFPTQPACAFTWEKSASNQPVMFKVKSWVMDGNGNFVGCVVKGYRSTILPTLSGIIIIGPLISALSQFDIFGGSATGVNFCCMAIQG